MLDIVLSSIIGSIVIISSLIIIVTVYLHEKSRQENLWKATANSQTVVQSAPISRRSSSSHLVNLKKASQSSRTRSASFSEDLSARLQILTSGTCYRSYSPTTIAPTKSSLNTNICFPIGSNSSSTLPSLTFQVRYEQAIETLSVTVFQLFNYPAIRNTPNVFVILYLLPNDGEQRQTRSSCNGIFNESFQFPLKSEELLQRSLRLTVYTVDSTTRIRNILGHVFFKLDRFPDENNNDKTFSNTLSEYLTQDLQIRSDCVGKLVLTTCYRKEQNLVQIRIQEINDLHLDQTKVKIPTKAHLSGQTSSTCHTAHHWTNTSSFIIPSSAFRIDQELNLTAHSSLNIEHESHIECHLRLHLHGCNQIHSHARWQNTLGSSLPSTLTVPLVAL